MRTVVLLLVLFVSDSAFAADDPFHTIAILENERKIHAAPNIHLAQYIRSEVKSIRIRAILAAARIGNPALLPELESVVSDTDPTVRKYIAFALGQIRSKKSLPTATLLLKDRNSDVRKAAIEAIGRIGGVDATTLILPHLKDQDPSIREQTALALALIKDKASVDVLLNKAKEPDSAQWSYVYALYRLADERSVAVLHSVLENPSASPSTGDPSSLLFALKALWAMKKPLMAPEVNALLQHKDPRVQQNALDVMAASVDKDACKQIQPAFLQMNVLSKMKAIEALGALDCLMDDKPSADGLLGGWLLAKAKSRKEQALPFLQEGSQHKSWTVRWRTAQALAELSATTAIPVLKVLSMDADSAVRLAALDSLTKFLPETAPQFIPLLEQKDFAIRATAVDALGKTKDPKYLPLLIKTYETGKDAAEAEGRAALLDILADFNTSESLAVFEKAIFDPEYTMRRHAIDGLKKLIGNSYFLHGKVRDPEEFLHSQDKVQTQTIESYSKEYGAPVNGRITMKLERGEVVIRLLGEEAPLHAANFKNWCERKFYDGLRIHRVVPNFVIQGGDPRGDGWGGAGEVVHDQFHMRPFTRGMVGMPTAGKDTGGSQFFITHSRQPHLDGNYTIFGEVISGMDVVDNTEVGDRILSSEVSEDR